MGRRKQANSIPQQSRVWRTAIYIRLSREDGNDESLSVQNQKKRLLAYLNGHRDELELVDTYVDDGYTGTDSNRESFQRMLEDIRLRTVDCVIVKDLSRLSRNYTEAGMYLDNLFIQYDVRFISLELPTLDSYRQPDQMNSILVPLQNVINDDFCRQTSTKVRNVFNMKRQNGEFIGAFAPYGYLKNPRNKHSFIIDEAAAPVVKDIFTWFIEDGMSIIGITKKLNELGIPNPAAYKRQNGMNYNNPHTEDNDGLWNPKTIRGILENESYLGHMVQGRQRVKSYKVHTRIQTPKEEWFKVEDTHAPIIDKEIFNLAQSLLLRDTRQAPGKKEVYPFAGLIKCADCGKAMVRRKAGSYVYYACRTYTEKSNSECTKHSIRLDKLEAAVLAAIQAQIGLVADISLLIDEINENPVVHTHSKRLGLLLQKKQAELGKVQKMSDSLYRDWKSGDITKDEYLRMKADFKTELDQLTSTINYIAEEQNVLAEGIGSEHPYFTRFKKYGNIETLDRGLLVEVIDTIHVHEGGEITITFNFADQYRRIVDYIENNHRELTVVDGGKTA